MLILTAEEFIIHPRKVVTGKGRSDRCDVFSGSFQNDYMTDTILMAGKAGVHCNTTRTGVPGFLCQHKFQSQQIQEFLTEDHPEQDYS